MMVAAMPPAPDAPRLMTVAEAVAIIDAETVEPRVISTDDLPIDRYHATPLLSRVLRTADALVTDRDYPPFDKALMDGFAVRSAETPGDLEIEPAIFASSALPPPLPRGRAAPIMTGACLPPGADAVVPVESATEEGGRVSLPGIGAGRYVAARGSDRWKGDAVLRAGTLLDSTTAAVAATVGATSPRVFAPARAVVITTGDEIVPPDRTPQGGQSRDASADMLRVLLSRCGATPLDAAHVVDDEALIRHRITHLSQFADVLFVTGGMSMGERDHVPKILLEVGFEFRVSKLRIKPGKPFVFAVLPARKSKDRRPRYAFGLPGNPVSAFVCTLVLASRLLARLGGGPADEFCREKVGTLTDPLGANGDRQFYQPCRVDDGSAGRRVTPLAWRGSADVFTLAEADALIVRPEGDGPRGAGEAVTIVEIPR